MNFLLEDISLLQNQRKDQWGGEIYAFDRLTVSVKSRHEYDLHGSETLKKCSINIKRQQTNNGLICSINLWYR